MVGKWVRIVSQSISHSAAYLYRTWPQKTPIPYQGFEHVKYPFRFKCKLVKKRRHLRGNFSKSEVSGLTSITKLFTEDVIILLKFLTV